MRVTTRNKIHAWVFWCARLYVTRRSVIINLPHLSVRMFDGETLPIRGDGFVADIVVYGWAVCVGWANRGAWFYARGAAPQYRWSWGDVEEYPAEMFDVLFGAGHSIPTRAAFLSAAMTESTRVKRLLRTVRPH